MQWCLSELNLKCIKVCKRKLMLKEICETTVLVIKKDVGVHETDGKCNWSGHQMHFFRLPS